MKAGWLAGFALLLGACRGAEPEHSAAPVGLAPEGQHLTIVYTNNLDGEVEPCG